MLHDLNTVLCSQNRYHYIKIRYCILSPIKKYFIIAHLFFVCYVCERRHVAHFVAIFDFVRLHPLRVVRTPCKWKWVLRLYTAKSTFRNRNFEWRFPFRCHIGFKTSAPTTRRSHALQTKTSLRKVFRIFYI